MANDLVLEALEEELSAAARAKGLIRPVPHRCLAATGGVRGPKLLQRRTARAGRDEDLTQPMPTEIAIKLSANSHVDLQGIPEELCQGIPCSHYPKNPARVPLNRARPQPAKLGGADELTAGWADRPGSLGRLHLEGDQGARIG